MADPTMPHVLDTYARLPVAFTHGLGCRVWDGEGRSYLDALGGIAVNTLGHAHPDLVAALRDQVGKLIHVSNYYRVPEQEALAERLCALSGLEAVFFCNSGLEANEAAIKLARKSGRDRGIAQPTIVVCSNAFHGRSLATLTATGNPKVQAGFDPLVPGFVRVPFDDLAAVEALDDPSVVAVFLETVQGEGGIRAASAVYLQGLRALCDARGWLLLLDEVQCGVARTGRWFAWEHAGVRPDVMCMAKGLGSGVPIGAVAVGARAMGVLGRGNHGTTFGGNPLAMRAGIETLRLVESLDLRANAAARGAQLTDALRSAFLDVPEVTAIRGMGLMVGVELDRPCGDLTLRALEAGLLISVTAEKVIRLLPPLVISAEEIDELVARLVPVVRAFLAA
jgi:acetylornithine/N-succinyldiaminopimelate aminotransferase